MPVPTPPAMPAVRAFVHRSLGDVSGLSVLDLGCGTGWLTAEIAGAGGRAIGIDRNADQLDHARAANPDAEFVVADLTFGLPDLGVRGFDRIVAQMLLADMAELDAMILDVGRTLVANGRFVFTIPHPAFTHLAITGGVADGGHVDPGYLVPSVTVDLPGGQPHYLRPLQWYVDLLADAGLAVVRIAEVLDTAPAGADAHGHDHGHLPLLGIVAVPVTPGLSLPVGRPTTVLGDHPG